MNEKIWDYIDKLNQLSSLTPEQQAGEGYVAEGVSPELIEKDVKALFALVKEAREACPEDWMFYLVANCFYFSMGLHMVYPHDIRAASIEGKLDLDDETAIENMAVLSSYVDDLIHTEEAQAWLVLFLSIFRENFSAIHAPSASKDLEEEELDSIVCPEVPLALQYFMLLSQFQSLNSRNGSGLQVKPDLHLLTMLTQYTDPWLKEAILGDFWKGQSEERLAFVPRLCFRSVLEETLSQLSPVMEDLSPDVPIPPQVAEKIWNILSNVELDPLSGIPCRPVFHLGTIFHTTIAGRKDSCFIQTPAKYSPDVLHVCYRLGGAFQELEEKEKELQEINQALLKEKERNERLVALHGHSWKYFSYPKLLEEVSEILYGRGNEEDVALGSDLQNAHHQSMVLHNQLMNLVNEFTHTAEGKRQLFSDSILPADHGESIQNLVEDTVKQLLYYAVFSPPGNLTEVEQVPTSVFHPDRRRALEESYQEEFKKNEGWIDPIDWFTGEIYPLTVEISSKWENFSFHYPKQAYVQVTTILMNLLSNAMNYGKKSKNKGFIRLNLGDVEKNGTKYLLIRCENPISADTAFLGRTGQGLLSLDEMAKSIHQNPPLFSEPYEFLQTKEKKGCFIVELYLEESLFLGSEGSGDV